MEQESKMGTIWREVIDCKKNYCMGPHEKRLFLQKNCTLVYIIICLCFRLYLGPSHSVSAYSCHSYLCMEASSLSECHSVLRCANNPGEMEDLGCGKRQGDVIVHCAMTACAVSAEPTNGGSLLLNGQSFPSYAAEQGTICAFCLRWERNQTPSNIK